MSREIKFRAWDNDKNKWLNKENEEYFVMYLDGSYEINRGWCIVKPNLTIEQYTGLKDKNGKEICEGDRIKIEGSDCVYTVEYGRGVWLARFGDEPGDSICLYHYAQKNNTVLYSEVIGNIHEPPKDFSPEHLKRMGATMMKGDEE